MQKRIGRHRTLIQVGSILFSLYVLAAIAHIAFNRLVMAPSSGRRAPEWLLQRKRHPYATVVKLKKDNARYSVAFRTSKLFFNDYHAGYLFDANGAMIAWEASAERRVKALGLLEVGQDESLGASPTLLR